MSDNTRHMIPYSARTLLSLAQALHDVHTVGTEEPSMSHCPMATTSAMAPHDVDSITSFDSAIENSSSTSTIPSVHEDNNRDSPTLATLNNDGHVNGTDSVTGTNMSSHPNHVDRSENIVNTSTLNSSDADGPANANHTNTATIPAVAISGTSVDLDHATESVSDANTPAAKDNHLNTSIGHGSDHEEQLQRSRNGMSHNATRPDPDSTLEADGPLPLYVYVLAGAGGFLLVFVGVCLCGARRAYLSSRAKAAERELAENGQIII